MMMMMMLLMMMMMLLLMLMMMMTTTGLSHNAVFSQTNVPCRYRVSDSKLPVSAPFTVIGGEKLFRADGVSEGESLNLDLPLPDTRKPRHHQDLL